MDEHALLLECMVEKWLRESEIGRAVLESCDLKLDEAVDSVFELLNAGFLKIVTDGDLIAGPDGGVQFRIEPRATPCPPARPIRRALRTRH